MNSKIIAIAAIAIVITAGCGAFLIMGSMTNRVGKST